MILRFKCKSNEEIPMINVAIFKNSNGLYRVDRKRTEFSYNEEENILEMDWKNLYILDDTGNPLMLQSGFFDSVTLQEFEIEDEASEEYEAVPIEARIDEKQIPISFL